jgi:hypothetical protein
MYKNHRYGLGFQPGQTFKLNPTAKKIWLAYSLGPALYALPLNSKIGKRLFQDMINNVIEDKEFHAKAFAESTAFWPDALKDAILVEN